MALLAFFIVVVLFFLWGIFFLIACGIGILSPWADRYAIAEHAKNYFPPIAETSDILLVAAFGALAIFFPGASNIWIRALALLLFIFLLLIATRMFGMHHRKKNQYRKWFAALGGFFAPAIFAGIIFPYFFLGAGALTFLGWPSDVMFALVGIAMALLLASSWLYYRARAAGNFNKKLVVAMSAIFSGFVVAIILLEYFDADLLYRIALIGPWYIVIVTPIMLALGAAIYYAKNAASNAALPWLLSVMTFAVLVLGACLAQMPYFIYGSAQIYDVFAGGASAEIFFWILGLMIIAGVAVGIRRYFFRRPRA